VGMGKLGGGELNVSSDIDLIYVARDAGEEPRYLERIARRLGQLLSNVTADGFVFRVDTRLRPYGDVGPLIATLPALGSYFHEQGRDDGGPVPVLLACEELLETITGFHLHRGALAAMNRPALVDVSRLLASARGGRGARRVAVLEDLVDHTNVGAAFRSAAALGVDAVLVTPRCADPLYRRSVRVSMGTVFQVPWTRAPRWPATDELHDAGCSVAALALSDDAVDLDDFAARPVCTAPDSKIALVLGTEGDGLRRRTLAAADYVVRIPMTGAVDSLNVAAAAAVAFWAVRVED